MINTYQVLLLIITLIFFSSINVMPKFSMVEPRKKRLKMAHKNYLDSFLEAPLQHPSACSQTRGDSPEPSSSKKNAEWTFCYRCYCTFSANHRVFFNRFLDRWTCMVAGHGCVAHDIQLARNFGVNDWSLMAPTRGFTMATLSIIPIDAAKYSAISWHFLLQSHSIGWGWSVQDVLAELGVTGPSLRRDATELREAAKNIPDSALPGEVSEYWTIILSINNSH